MSKSGYSSKILLTLIVCGTELALSHVGSRFVIIKQSLESFDSCNAELLVSVDGKVKKKSVYLPYGIAAGSDQQVLYL